MTKSGTVSLTFSIDMDLLTWIEDYSKSNRISRSSAIRYLIRMGKTYLKVLDEQVATLEKEAAEDE